jgi:hypothetical protein
MADYGIVTVDGTVICDGGIARFPRAVGFLLLVA